MQRQNRPASDTLRYHGVDAATEIEEGDLLYLDTDDVKPASSQADQLSPAANYALFQSKFAGVAVGRHRGGTDPAGVIAVQADGVWLYPCASGTWEIGDGVAAAENAGGTGLEDQKVSKTVTANEKIGVCVQRETAAVTEVWVRLTAELGFISGNVGG